MTERQESKNTTPQSQNGERVVPGADMPGVDTGYGPTDPSEVAPLIDEDASGASGDLGTGADAVTDPGSEL